MKPLYTVRFSDGRKYTVEASSWLEATRKAVQEHAQEAGEGQILDIEPASDCDDIVSIG